MDSAVAGTGPRGTYASRAGPTLRTCTLASAPLASRRRSTVQPDLFCTSPHAHDCSSGAGRPSSSRLRSHRSASVVAKTLTLGDDRGLEVADVIDAPDDHPAVSSLDEGDGRVLDPKGKQPTAWLADDAMQRDLDHTTVGHDQDVAVRVALEDAVDRLRDSSVEGRLALAAWHHVPVRLFDPARPCVRITRGYLICAQTFPLAQVDLAQRRLGARGQADPEADDVGGLKSALQVARVMGREAAAGQPRAQELGLAAAFGGKRRVELALDAVLAVPGRLAVPDEDKARGSWTGRQRELRWLRARGSDLDAYT